MRTKRAVFGVTFIFQDRSNSGAKGATSKKSVFVSIRERKIAIHFRRPSITAALGLNSLLPVETGTSMLTSVGLFMTGRRVISEAGIRRVVSLRAFSRAKAFRLHIRTAAKNGATVTARVMAILKRARRKVLPRKTHPNVGCLGSARTALMLRTPKGEAMCIMNSFGS